MKKRWSSFIAIVIVTLLVSGCAGQAGKTGTNGVNGKDGLNGTNGTNGLDGTNGLAGTNGLNGKNGSNGSSPIIGTNGNWWIGTTDTGVKASGTNSDFVFKSVTLSNDLVGAVQKGPFISGTSINIYELNQSFRQTGFSYNAQTTDNVGTFSLPKGLELASNNLLFIAQGFYYNEVLGKNSEVPLTMYLVSDISNQSKVNINLISTLEKQRIMYLIENGSTYSDASNQARKEILDIFYIVKPDIASSQDLDITKDGDDNAILLAISVILQGYRTTSELSLLLAEIGNDIKTDGKLDSEKLKTQLINDAKLLDLSKIRENLETFYFDNNITVSVPNFESYVNQFISNNALSSNPYIFTKYITYPIVGENGLNLLDKNLTEIPNSIFADPNSTTKYSIAANLPVGTMLKVVFTSISANNTVLNLNTLDATKWTVLFTNYSNKEDIPLNAGADGPDVYSTVEYYSNNNYGDFEIQTQIDMRWEDQLITHDMFRIDYYENGAVTPTYSKIMKLIANPS